MANNIFIDTSGFYAALIRADNQHNHAREIFCNAAKNHRIFVTTDYVLDETLTLLKARGHQHLGQDLMQTVFNSGACNIEWMDAERFQKVWQLTARTKDQNWSFTDCFSFWIMKELNVSEALTKDSHFEHAGFVALLA